MKIVVRSLLTMMGFAIGAVLITSCTSSKKDDQHDSMYECKDGKCYPKKKPEQPLGK